VVFQQAVADRNTAAGTSSPASRPAEGAEGRPAPVPVPQGPRQAIRFTASARFKVLASGKLRLPKTAGRAGALVAPAAV
jgi:putative transposase